MRVFLIEQEIDEGEIITSALSHAGIVVERSVNLSAAIELIQNEDGDAIIINRPMSSGNMTLIKDIRACRMDIPILAIGNRDGENCIAELLQSGADDAMSWPIHRKELIARTQALLRREPGLRGVILRVSDLEIDTGQQVVSCHGRRMSLSPTEYKILLFLGARPRTVVPIRSLARYIYGPSEIRRSNVIEAHISNLRRKLQKAESGSNIETLRFRGYRFMEYCPGMVHECAMQR